MFDRLKDIIAAEALPGHRLRLRFGDGVEGVVDLKGMLDFRGVFGPLENEMYFAKVRVNAELGVVEWPNGADLDPDVLYARITGRALPGEARVK